MVFVPLFCKRKRGLFICIIEKVFVLSQYTEYGYMGKKKIKIVGAVQAATLRPNAKGIVYAKKALKVKSPFNIHSLHEKPPRLNIWLGENSDEEEGTITDKTDSKGF